MSLKKCCPILLASALLCLGAASGLAETPYASTVNFIVSDFAYRESQMKNVGGMCGLNLNFSKIDDSQYWNTDLTLETGKVRYTGGAQNPVTGDFVHFGSGNNNNTLVEARVVGGIPIGTVSGSRGPDTWSFIPYGGLAYRFLDNRVPWSIDDTLGFVEGYDRRSNYLYSPIGVRIGRAAGTKWSITATAEYDLFWSGVQYSYIGSTITNRQTSGYGARGSITLRYKGKDRDFIIEPFITYWNVGKSEPLITPTDIPDQVLVIYEPQNSTMEVGCKFGISF